MKCVSLYIWFCCFLALINGQTKPIGESENVYMTALRLMSVFDKVFNYRNFIIYGNFDAEMGPSVGFSFVHQVMTKFKKPVIIAGSRTDSMYTFISTHNYAVVFFRGKNDPLCDIVNDNLRRLTYLPILFVYESKENVPLYGPEIEAFFKWCWKFHLYYVSLIFKGNRINEIWSYDFKSNFNIYQTFDQNLRDLNLDSLGLMERHQSTVSVYQSVPEVFVYQSMEQNDITGSNKSLGGEVGVMLTELMRYVNGTMRIVELPRNNLCHGNTLSCVDNITVDFGANLQWTTNVNFNNPLLKLTKYCLVVPYKRQMSIRKYLNIICANWTTLSFFVFYFFANVVIKKLNHRRLPLDELIFRSIEICCHQSISDRAVRNMRKAEKIMMICTMVYNLLLLAIICGALTTHITTGINMPEIVDIDSFVANDLRIMVPFIHKNIVLSSVSIPKEIRNNIIFVDDDIYDYHVDSLNDSFVYIIPTHKWVQYEFAQKRLREPKLKLAPEPLCSTSRILGLPARPALPLIFKLTNFIQYSIESGLGQKWLQIGLQQMKKANLIKQLPYDPPTHLRLPLEFFMGPFLLLLTGLLISFVVFIFECILTRVLLHSNEHNNVIVV